MGNYVFQHKDDKTITVYDELAGEDGMIRIWSRSGMLRSTIVRATQPILAASWSPDCTSILYTQGTQLVFQSLNTSTKPLKV